MCQNYMKLRSVSPFWEEFIFIDTERHFFEGIMQNNGINLRNVKEYIKGRTPFRLIHCKVRKKDRALFCDVIPEIRNMVLLMGYPEYDDLCTKMQNCRWNLQSK